VSSGGAGWFVSVSAYQPKGMSATADQDGLVSIKGIKFMGQVDETQAIREYHAHVYFDAVSRERAANLRTQVETRFRVQVHPLRTAPIGPHLFPQYQIVFDTDQFPAFVPFLMMNRKGLTVLVHPQTGRPRDDHTANAMWMGEVLPVNVASLREVETPV
jgi:aromatic ring-cleaving dioxygenase